ncbi:hypothetical protein SAMN05444678_102276 [Sphingomonas sp. YR710]|uniref:hypothetical protein n=1 Tax=Sphingomonas sp. YR710 TaxID=1882773 RepID=UPI000884E9DE|nr:hypothetical protein [Sphingomonas sp. YR710]SDC31359.1 hypothetical protein SAMN05444678_102276 [Sphingomonas sp. YR710]
MKSILNWLGRKVKEPSTYVGLATIATVAGAPAAGAQIGAVGQAVALILGGGLVAHSPQAPAA